MTKRILELYLETFKNKTDALEQHIALLKHENELIKKDFVELNEKCGIIQLELSKVSAPATILDPMTQLAEDVRIQEKHSAILAAYHLRSSEVNADDTIDADSLTGSL